MVVAGLFCTTYGYCCYKGMSSRNEVIRMGLAGSLSNVIIEGAFHFFDTVNVRAKVSTKNLSSLGMVKKIYAKEGI